MKEKINIAELHKDCPKGMELDCTMYNDASLHEVYSDRPFPIVLVRKNGDTFVTTKYGQYQDEVDSKCVIFPKGKTTWEGFVPPFTFKDGDILFVDGSHEGDTHRFIFILDTNNKYEKWQAYCYLFNDDSFRPERGWLIKEEYQPRLATEEEKQKLFDAIKANGYKWNEKTKTLEKLIEPKFKVGDRIKHIVGREEIATVVGVEKLHYILDSKVGTSSFTISLQDEWELISNKFDISSLIPFESKVLVRNNKNHLWKPVIFGGCVSNNIDGYNYIVLGGVLYKYLIPYEGNEHLIGKTDNCDNYYKTWE